MLNFHKMFNSLRVRPRHRYSWEPSTELLQICNSLDNLRQKHSLIYISISGAADSAYQSIILDLDREQGCFEIDELFPVGFLLEVGHKVAVTVKTSSEQSLTFYSTVRERRTVSGSTTYILNLPAHVDGHQRRDAYRLVTRGQVAWGEHNPCGEASIRDISISGVKLSIPEELQSDLQVGREIEDATLTLNGMKVTTDLRITRRGEADDRAGIVTIGARMTTLDPVTRRKLEQFIMREQRFRRNRA